MRGSVVAVLAALLLGAWPTQTAAAAPAEHAVSPAGALVVRPAIPKAQLWQGAGVIVADAAGFAPDRARTLRRSHFRWVAVKIHHGLDSELRNGQALRDGWARGFRRNGIRVCGWGVLDDEPVLEARLATALVAGSGLDCYVADAEGLYMGAGYGGVVSRSSEFVRAFRERAPLLPGAVTTEGAAIHPWVLPFDYASWRDHGFALLPQAYLSIEAHYGPSYAVAHAVRAGYTQERVHPMIGIGWAEKRRKHWGGDYVWRLVRAQTTGFSVFLGETTGDVDFDVLGRGIVRYGISR